MTFFNTLSLILHQKQWLYRDDDGDDKKKMDTSKKIETMATRSESSVDNGWGASNNQILTKTQTTMKNENKCFFSISLENGITITGESPQQVREFLEHMWNGLIAELHDPEDEQKQFPTWYRKQAEFAKEINYAIVTINNNLKKK